MLTYDQMADVLIPAEGNRGRCDKASVRPHCGVKEPIMLKAYKSIKNMEKQGKERTEICEFLKENFGEKNPDVKVG